MCESGLPANLALDAAARIDLAQIPTGTVGIG
jgi:hypothetical protein